ncbi:MAG: Gfo/Idh/MocA family oxidoreductase [Chloroflexi bacterium]|nr:Gfo/Idh/MocA family oxidoreductase [Chloroflexota bacterium]
MGKAAFKPVRVGVVGLGNFGRLHALTLAGLAEAELVALVARRQASVDALSAELQAVSGHRVPGWTDLEQAIQEAAPEAAPEAWVVAASTASHVPVARRLLAAGYPVLVEKPLAGSLAEAESLAPLVRADSSNLMLGHILLFNSEFRQLQAEVRARSPMAYIHCARHRPATTLARFPGESPFHLLMVHDLYSVLALVDRREPVAFCAQTRHTSAGECDLTLAQLRWEDGLVASFAASFLTPEGMPADGFDRMEVYGQGWAARVEANPRPLTVWDEQARAPMTLEILADPIAPSGMLAEELRCFCRVVRGVQPVPMGATYHDALQVQRWLDRLERAAEAQ